MHQDRPSPLLYSLPFLLPLTFHVYYHIIYLEVKQTYVTGTVYLNHETSKSDLKKSMLRTDETTVCLKNLEIDIA